VCRRWMAMGSLNQSGLGRCCYRCSISASAPPQWAQSLRGTHDESAGIESSGPLRFHLQSAVIEADDADGIHALSAWFARARPRER
jgi:hypothetical protein